MENFNKEEHKIKFGENKTYDVVIEYGKGTPKAVNIDDFSLPKTPTKITTKEK